MKVNKQKEKAVKVYCKECGSTFLIEELYVKGYEGKTVSGTVQGLIDDTNGESEGETFVITRVECPSCGVGIDGELAAPEVWVGNVLCGWDVKKGAIDAISGAKEAPFVLEEDDEAQP